jgi:predicted glycogen debranching enzyme
LSTEDGFGKRLIKALQAYVVRRDSGKTVVAGYPWFLDWGRDSLISARGLLSAGWYNEVRDLLLVFGGLCQDGTFPNSLNAQDTSNRDTSDAPLWYAVVCEEAARLSVQYSSTNSPRFYEAPVDGRGRTIADILREIAVNFIKGTPNGIRVDMDSMLVWSPPHFTWMDTNYPASTPRQGYPIEIQALWIRLLRQLETIAAEPLEEPWVALAKRATDSLQQYYWLPEKGWFSDCLFATANQPASMAVVDQSLRPNQLFAICNGLLDIQKSRQALDAITSYLVVPGAMRSLAPLKVVPPLPVFGTFGLLNNPDWPYWGRYEGDEDTRRKPAYHNGTAWVWLLPTYCEALARVWNQSPEAIAAALAYLGSMDPIMHQGCLGHLPEILDGDAPHQARGCDAQAWSVSETFRVWKLLNTGRNRG